MNGNHAVKDVKRKDCEKLVFVEFHLVTSFEKLLHALSESQYPGHRESILPATMLPQESPLERR